MDPELLREQGLHPRNSTLAFVRGYGLRIGERATLIKSDGEIVYGQIISLAESEVDKLYGSPSVVDYVPMKLTATTETGDGQDCIGYVLPASKLVGVNPDYVASLCKVLEKLGLPSHYVDQIRKLRVDHGCSNLRQGS